MTTQTGFTFGARSPLPIDEIRPRVVAALKDEGFGVLTEIDVAATLKAKLGIDLPPYLILGACNPQLAHRALEIEPSVGALLPCNVVLRRDERDAETVIEILDPEAAFTIAGTAALAPIAAEAASRLRRVLARIGAS